MNRDELDLLAAGIFHMLRLNLNNIPEMEEHELCLSVRLGAGHSHKVKISRRYFGFP